MIRDSGRRRIPSNRSAPARTRVHWHRRRRGRPFARAPRRPPGRARAAPSPSSQSAASELMSPPASPSRLDVTASISLRYGVRSGEEKSLASTTLDNGSVRMQRSYAFDEPADSMMLAIARQRHCALAVAQTARPPQFAETRGQCVLQRVVPTDDRGVPIAECCAFVRYQRESQGERSHIGSAKLIATLIAKMPPQHPSRRAPHPD